MQTNGTSVVDPGQEEFETEPEGPFDNGANGPVWQWGDELLVGFAVGTFAQTAKGHQCRNDRPFDSWLARSTGGGESWQAWKPEGYAGQPAPTRPLAGAVDFSAPGFALRIEGNGCHGNAACRWPATLSGSWVLRPKASLGARTLWRRLPLVAMW